MSAEFSLIDLTGDTAVTAMALVKAADSDPDEATASGRSPCSITTPALPLWKRDRPTASHVQSLTQSTIT